MIMALTAAQEKVRTLLADTISLLCKNSLQYDAEFSVEGLIGITVDRKNVFLVSLKETVKHAACPPDSRSEVDNYDNMVQSPPPPSHWPRRWGKKRRHSDVSDSEEEGEITSGRHGELADLNLPESEDISEESCSQNFSTMPTLTSTLDPPHTATTSEVKPELDKLTGMKQEMDLSAFGGQGQSEESTISEAQVLGSLMAGGGLGVSSKLVSSSPSSSTLAGPVAGLPAAPDQQMEMLESQTLNGLGALAQAMYSGIWRPHVGTAAVESTLGQSMSYNTEPRSGPVECPICKKVFRTRESLSVHKNIHSTAFQCRQCGKGFACNSKLQAHLSTHDESLKLTCSFCGRRFGGRGELNRHMYTRHGTKDSGLT